jgi:hypothetical protein
VPRRFARRFNDLSCISPVAAPCISPVLFLQAFSSPAPPEKSPGGAFSSRVATARGIEHGEPNMRFQSGQSGNPTGRPRGARNKRTILAEKLLEDRVGEVTTAAIDLAKAGDPIAVRVCMDRVVPRLRHGPLDFALPELVTLADVPAAYNAIGQRLACGELDPEQAALLMKIVREFQTSLAAVERATRAAAETDAGHGTADAGEAESLANFLAARIR